MGTGPLRMGHHRPHSRVRQVSSVVAVRYTQRSAVACAVASVGSTGDSYDNAPGVQLVVQGRADPPPWSVALHR